MRYLGLLLFLLPCLLFGQKVLTKTYPVPDKALVQLDVHHNYLLEVATSEREDILVEALMEGEYRGEMLVHLTTEGTTVNIATRSQPAFDFPNDKLAAHKVISVGLRVTLPRYLSVQVYGESANVRLSGVFHEADVALSSGNTTLDIEAEQVGVRTQSGNIVVYKKDEGVLAKSQYGRVQDRTRSMTKPIYNLRTITGNITIHNKE